MEDNRSIRVQKIALPQGGGAIRGIGETFQPNHFSGTGSYTIPIPVTPARGFEPQLTLSYNSGAGNSEFGLGFFLSLPKISIRTEKGIPKYDGKDTFIAGTGVLVPKAKAPYRDGDYQVQEYLPRIEGSFSLIQHYIKSDQSESYWKITTNDEVTTVYGRSPETRIADIQSPSHIFEWLIESSIDSKGNTILYGYKQENDDGIEPKMSWEMDRANTKKYITNIQYGNYFSGQDEKFAFEIIFDYGEYDIEQLEKGNKNPYIPSKQWSYRNDAFSSYKSAFEIRTRRLCKNILLFHHFENKLGDPCLVKSLSLKHEPADKNPLSLLKSVILTGYSRKGNKSTDPFEIQTMPAVEFNFSAFNPAEKSEFNTLNINNDQTIPGYLNTSGFQPIDFNGEGLSGLLYSDNTSLLYFEPLGNGNYASAEAPDKFPIDKAFQSGQALLADIEGNGELELVVRDSTRTGFYQKREKNSWEPFKPFTTYPSDFDNPAMEMAGLSSNGKTDMLLVTENDLLLYPSLGKAGYANPEQISTPAGFPLRKNIQKKQYVGFDNIFGDGLSHRVRIANGSVECWPDLGYGNFGEKVTLGNAPDFGEQFSTDRLFLADIDGSGTTDLIYVHPDKVDLYLNQSGNSFSAAISIELPELYSTIDQISFADILGNGTTCLIFTKIATTPQHYYYNFVGENLVDGVAVKTLKPYLLNRINNNLGAITEIQYASSTQFYLEDKKNGNHWITKLPFPVQLVEKTITTDHITNSRYTKRFKYHDGYYDSVEKEFKGFGYVESWDTETYEELLQNEQQLGKKNYVPPIYTRTWYNTGAMLENNPIYNYYKFQFFSGDTEAYDFPNSVLQDKIYDQGLDTILQAYGALSGQVLRTEVYGLDETPEAANPYTVNQSNFSVTLHQEKNDNEYAVFMVTPRENIAYQYERNPDDPRVQQSFTLEVDDFGNVLQAAVVMLPRRGDTVYAEQQTLKAGIELNTYVQPLEESRYCHVACEQQKFKVNGLDLQGNNYFSFHQIKSQVSVIDLPGRQNIIPYNQPFTGGIQARQQTWDRQYFWNEDQTTTLPLGQIATKALLHHNETAVFPESFVHEVFTKRLTKETLETMGGYYLNESYWWNRGLVQYYFTSQEPQAFYLPCKTENSFADVSSSLFTQTTVAYNEPYYFSVTQVSQYIDKTTYSAVQAEIDYRTQQPRQLIDSNNNTSQVLFDPLGQVVVTSLFGTENGIETGNMTLYPDGQTPAEYTPVYDATFEDVINHPENYLQGASSYFYYNLHAWKDNQQPASAVNLIRYNYWKNPAKNTMPYCQIAIGYSDGIGRNLEQKIQVEPVDGKNWQVSGRTVYNNKGKPFEQYLPYFSDTPDYEKQDDIATPPPTVLHYDPLERVIRTDTPKGFFSKVEFTPWQEQSFDEDDTVCDSDYYNTFMDSYPTDPTQQQKDEKDALEKAAKFYNTPNTKTLDNTGRVFLDSQLKDISEPALISYYKYDISGRLLLSIDPRLYRSHVENGTDYYNFKYVYAMGEQNPALTDSIDSGIHCNLNNIYSQQLWSLSPRNYCQLITYDHLQRQTTLQVKKTAENIPIPINRYSDFNLVEQFTYGDQLTIKGKTPQKIQDLNLWGVLYQLNDLSGVIINSRYSMQGNILESSRQMTEEYKQNINWRESVPLEETVYISQFVYNATGLQLNQTTPDGTVTTNNFNQQGALCSVNLAFKDGNTQAIVNQVQYDAKGQRTFIDYGNEVRTSYTYEDTTLNLIAIKSIRQTDKKTVQDIEYVYDPVGNITRTRDKSLETVFNNNQKIEPLSDYTYDALYRLQQANGRQHTGITADTYKNNMANGSFKQCIFGPPPSSVNDTDKLENYTELYTYDDGGNLCKKQHIADSAQWTMETPVEDYCNRLQGVKYDASGNMRQLMINNNVPLSFNCCENLVKTGIITRPDESDDCDYYNYDRDEQRTRKVSQRLAQDGEVTLIEEKIYLGNYEIKRNKSLNGQEQAKKINFERQTLRVMDDTGCIAIIHYIAQDTRHHKEEGVRQCRFQLDNNLGSVSLELDVEGLLISYEEYFPYGGTAIISGKNQAEVALKDYRYCGKECDDTTGLYYYGARYYAPWLGRWLKPDPAGTVDGMNLYAFVKGNPVTLRDVGGLASDRPWENTPQRQIPQATSQPPTENKTKLKKGVINIIGEAHDDMEKHRATEQRYAIDEGFQFFTESEFENQAGIPGDPIALRYLQNVTILVEDLLLLRHRFREENANIDEEVPSSLHTIRDQIGEIGAQVDVWAGHTPEQRIKIENQARQPGLFEKATRMVTALEPISQLISTALGQEGDSRDLTIEQILNQTSTLTKNIKPEKLMNLEDDLTLKRSTIMFIEAKNDKRKTSVIWKIGGMHYEQIAGIKKQFPNTINFVEEEHYVAELNSFIRRQQYSV